MAFLNIYEYLSRAFCDLLFFLEYFSVPQFWDIFFEVFKK